MRPTAKLGVPEPVWNLVLLERFPSRLKFTGCNRLATGIDNDVRHRRGGNRVRRNMIQGESGKEDRRKEESMNLQLGKGPND